MQRTARKNAWFILAVVGASVLFFYRFTLTSQILIARDILRVYYPVRSFWVQQVSQGKFPGWYPYDGLGMPLPGSIITGVFHPSNILYLLFSLTTALKINVFLCYPFAFFGCYKFFRRYTSAPSSIVGAAGYAFGGYLVSMSNNLLYLMSAACIPWTLYSTLLLVEDPSWKRAGVPGLIWATIFLAGDPQCLVLTAATMIALCWFLPIRRDNRWRSIKTIFISLGLGTLVCGVQLVCAFQVMKEGRVTNQAAQEAMVWSFHPLRLIDLLLGDVLYVPAHDRAITVDLLSSGAPGFWSESVYLGFPICVLACLGLWRFRQRRLVLLAGALTVAAFAVALGRFTPVYSYLFDYVPLWRTFRYPEKVLPHFFFWVCFLAANGLDVLRSEDWTGARRLSACFLVVSSVCLAAYAFLQIRLEIPGLRNMYHGELGLWRELSDILLHRLNRVLLHGAIVASLCALVLRFGRNKHRQSIALAAIVIADVLFVCEPVYKTSDPSMIEVRPGFLDVIERREGSRIQGRTRIHTGSDGFYYGEVPLDIMDVAAATTINALLPDTNGMWMVESSVAYMPGSSARVNDLQRDVARWWGRFMSMSNVGYVAVNAVDYRRMGKMERVIAENVPFRLYLLGNAKREGRVQLAVPRCVKGAAESLAAIRDKDFKPGQYAILECEPSVRLSSRVEDGENLGTAEITEYRPEEISILVKANADAALVLADAFYSGWTATMDSAPAQILPANHAFRGIIVPPGLHRVVFRYETPHLALGILISAIGVGLCIGPVVRKNNFRPKGAGASERR